MTKNQAKEAVKKGFKVTHKDFVAGEYVTEFNGDFVDEQGIPLDFDEFFNRRYEDFWDEGWSVIPDIIEQASDILFPSASIEQLETMLHKIKSRINDLKNR